MTEWKSVTTYGPSSHANLSLDCVSFIRVQYSVTAHCFAPWFLIRRILHSMTTSRMTPRSRDHFSDRTRLSFTKNRGLDSAQFRPQTPKILRLESISGVRKTSHHPPKVPFTINGAVSPLPSERAPLHWPVHPRLIRSESGTTPTKFCSCTESSSVKSKVDRVLATPALCCCWGPITVLLSGILTVL